MKLLKTFLLNCLCILPPFSAFVAYAVKTKAKLFGSNTAVQVGEFMLGTLIIVALCFGFAVLSMLMDQENAKRLQLSDSHPQHPATASELTTKLPEGKKKSTKK